MTSIVVIEGQNKYLKAVDTIDNMIDELGIAEQAVPSVDKVEKEDNLLDELEIVEQSVR